jgi:hypothetical protein
MKLIEFIKLTKLLAAWNRREPNRCFPIRTSRCSLCALRLDGKNHCTVDPEKMKSGSWAILQGAVQHSIKERNYIFRLDFSKGSYTAIVWNVYGEPFEATDEQPAIALLVAYLRILESQAEIEVEAEEVTPSVLWHQHERIEELALRGRE